MSSIWGFSFMFSKQALDVLPPTHMLGLRFATASLTLTVLVAARALRLNLDWRGVLALLPLAAFQPVTYFLGESNGVRLTNSSQAGMIIALIPVVVTVFAAIFLREIPTRAQVGFILMSVAGVGVVVYANPSNGSSGQALGIVLLLLAVVSAAAYQVLSRKLSVRFSAVDITFVMMWLGALVFNGLALAQRGRNGTLAGYLVPLGDIRVLVPILYLGIMASVVAFLLANYMLSRLEAPTAATFANLTTVVSIFAGIIFRNEPFSYLQFVGAAMILLGVWGAQRTRRGIHRTGSSVSVLHLPQEGKGEPCHE